MINLNRAIYVLLHLFLLFAFIFAFMIYTSLDMNFPWYDSYGIQFLNLFTICIPILFIAGISLILLNTKYPILKGNLFLPFYSAVGILFPILVDDSLSKATLMTGVLCSFISILLTVVFSVNQLTKKNIIKKMSKIQIFTVIFLICYIIWELNVSNWSVSVLGPRIRVDLIFIYPVLSVLIGTSIYQWIKAKINKK